ncbi:hypothetical protein F2P56_036397 [Juglans regia]|uniref:Protein DETOXIFICATION n=1 Tax=Juglans regia TaxID=51240 RepID=A0A833X736_JUGRE|nr:hypothetical protein F2P56_036397 [Juglans regia]
MQSRILIARPPCTHLFQNHTHQRPLSLFPRFKISLFPSNLLITSAPKARRNCIKTACISPARELFEKDSEISDESDSGTVSVSEQVLEVEGDGAGSGDRQTIWHQMKEIVKFTGPATGLWICGPLMSLIDTAVIGQGSSIELAALGPATVMCDSLSYVFMFLSIATSNMVATSLAKKDKNEVQHHISNLLFVGLTCGCLMLLFTKFFGSWALTAFTGPKSAHVIPAANTYVQIRGLAWPAVLIGWVTQSASLGMKDSWGPLKALAVASAVNAVGDIVLCSFLGYGIAGAAWATAASQVIAGYMMIESLNKKGYDAFAISVPSLEELRTVFGLAAPVFVTMISKVAFFSLITYLATSMGTYSMAAHQVMVQTFFMCTVWGEPLSQTAQSFMPELIYGVRRNLEKMHKVMIPFFLALAVTPPTLSLEGTLLAGRDLKFISLSMSGCLCVGALLLLLISSRGYGLSGCWFGLVGFQWARFFLSLQRLLSSNGVLHSDDLSQVKLEKLRAA